MGNGFYCVHMKGASIEFPDDPSRNAHLEMSQPGKDGISNENCDTIIDTGNAKGVSLVQETYENLVMQLMEWKGIESIAKFKEYAGCVTEDEASKFPTLKFTLWHKSGEDTELYVPWDK